MVHLNSSKKFYKRIVPILVNTHLQVINLSSTEGTYYGAQHGKDTWRLFIDDSYALLEYKRNSLKQKWIWKWIHGEDS